MAKYKIVDGPGKFDLMLALFEGKQAEFKIKHPGSSAIFAAAVQINEIAAEDDGSRQSWNLRGHIVNLAGISGNNFKAYFDSRNRQGIFDI